MDDSVQEVSNEHNQWAGFIEGENVIRRGREILLQGFNWESHKHKWWPNLEQKILHIAKAGFTSVWLPPAFDSLAPQGYLPRNIYSLNSAYGSENQLKSLLMTMQNNNVRAMADIVINHRVGSTQGCGGLYNRYDGLRPAWDERAVTCCTGGLGNLSTGDNFDGVPNIDHTQDFVRKDIKEWLIWLQKSVGFQDFRFDFAKGFAAKFVREYVEASDPMFSVGEYWVSCNYDPSSNHLDYNQDSHRQKIVDWINGTGGLSAAFDFTTKGILQEAVKGEWWRLRDCKAKPSGVLGWWPSRAVTFIENHDTGSTQAHWPFPSDHIMEHFQQAFACCFCRTATYFEGVSCIQHLGGLPNNSYLVWGYAYILTHPGIPTVFHDHFFDWGSSIQKQIIKLMNIRRTQDLHSRSAVRILEANSSVYAAIIGEKVCMKIGDGSWCPNGKEWKLATCGHRYAVWHMEH